MPLKRAKAWYERQVLQSSALPFLCHSLIRDGKRLKEVQERLAASGLVHPFDFDELRGLKTSDTLFILGSGESINDITEEQWAQIRQHDSVGFNFWLVHPFVPTFFFWELPGKGGRRDVFIELMRFKQAAYKRTPVIVKRVWSGREEGVRSAVEAAPEMIHYLSISLDLPPKQNASDSAFVQSLETLRGIGALHLLLKRNLLWHRRGTLSELIAFACGMGYRTVILCGVDLTGTDYFFDVEDYTWQGDGLPIPPKRPATVHSTIDPAKDDLPVDEVLYHLHEHVLQKQGMTLLVAHQGSKLYPKLQLPDLFMPAAT